MIQEYWSWVLNCDGNVNMKNLAKKINLLFKLGEKFEQLLLSEIVSGVKHRLDPSDVFIFPQLV